MGTTGGNIKIDSIDEPAEATAEERIPAKIMAGGQSAEATRAAGAVMSAGQVGSGFRDISDSTGRSYWCPVTRLIFRSIGLQC